MRRVFEETKINNLTIKNRLMRSATWEGMCNPDGAPTQKLTDCYCDLARGGIGLIITGYTFVRPDGRQMPGKMGLYSDDLVPAMMDMVRGVHEADGKICAQLVHAGGQAKSKVSGSTPIAPSAVDAEQYQGEIPLEMSAADIKDVTSAFADAARRAKDAGFDAVQLHAAHGYLINQFLSPHTNHRTDEYGGSIANRARFLLDVYGAVRQAVGDDFTIMVKLNGADNLEGGLSNDDAVIAAQMLDKAGIDAIEVSGGTPASGSEGPVREKIKDRSREAYNLPYARAIREKVSCPVISVGGYRSIEVVEDAIKNDVDYVSISRPLIREPNLANRWAGGDRSRATCVSCNKCFLPGIKEGGIYCVKQRKKELKEQKQH